MMELLGKASAADYSARCAFPQLPEDIYQIFSGSCFFMFALF